MALSVTALGVDFSAVIMGVAWLGSFLSPEDAGERTFISLEYFGLKISLKQFYLYVLFFI